MKILKLYEHRKNPGGIVNLQLDLEKFFDTSQHTYAYFRTGKIFKHRIWSKGFFRLFDMLFSYGYFPIFLLATRPDSIEINTSFIKKSFLRDFIFLMESRLFAPEAKKVIFIHGWSEKFKSDFVEKHHLLFRNFDHIADTLIVLADQFKKSLIVSGVNPNKIQVITTGINIKDFEATPKAITKNPHILFLSRLALDKGIMEFLEAIPPLLQYNNSLHFDIAGSGEAEKALLESRIFRTYRSNITFHGYLTGEAKIKLLKKSTLFVFPSSHGEGFPISILEAMAAGLPLIYTPSGGLLEHLQNGINGIEIPPQNTSAIVDAVIRLLEGQILAENMGNTNLMKAKSTFDIELVFSKLEDIHSSKRIKTIHSDMPLLRSH